MVITKIHPIKSTLNLAISHITNENKTDDKILITASNCFSPTAHTQFLRTREHNDIKGNVLARHLIQSFLPGETSPEIAHQIGLDLCKKILKEKYEFVLSTHIDKGHIHNHIIFNNVNMVTGKCINPIRKAIIKLGIKVINFVKKMDYLLLMSSMKLIRKNIKLVLNHGMKINNLSVEHLGKAGFNLTLTE